MIKLWNEPCIGKLCTLHEQYRASSETQRQIVGARDSLNRRKNMAKKESKERPEEPLGTMSYQTSSKRSPPFWLLIGARKLVFCKTLSPGALLAVLYFSSFHIYFSARLDFLSPPLSAPGSPRMLRLVCHFFSCFCHILTSTSIYL